jgi:D-sedoheptulose 7-phosphate isomerase
MITNWIESYLNDQINSLRNLDLNKVENIINLILTKHKKGRKIYVAGNGGSASNASHFATDLGKSSSDAIGERINVLSLNENLSWITAIGNDYCFEDIYVRQLSNYAQESDLLLLLSVSGNSPNIVKAAQYANDNDINVISLVGEKRCELDALSDISLHVPSTHYGRVEDIEMTICHLICYHLIENNKNIR